jgi:hypothetical protein
MNKLLLGSIGLGMCAPLAAHAQSFVPGEWVASTWNTASFATASEKVELLSTSSAIGTGTMLVTTSFWKIQNRSRPEIVRCVDTMDATKPEAVPVGRCFMALSK